MKERGYTSIFFLLLFFVVVFINCSMMTVDAGKHHTRKSRAHKNERKKSGGGTNAPDSANLPNLPAPLPNTTNVFDVLSFGAKGDGLSDDSEALLAAWKAACKVPGATIEFPSDFKFSIKPLTLQGPCMPHLVLQIDGTLLAPPRMGSWPKSSLLQWINFKWVQNFTIQGTGTIDGQGSDWWNTSPFNYIRKKSKFTLYKKPTAVRIYGSYDVTVRDITIINSPQFHLKFDSSGVIKVINITIASPENSPNTDGIHLQNTRDVQIQHSNIGCGDDCVSIQTGCSNIHIHHINCGPGHGISLGGLGKDRSVACVSDVIVESISIQNTLYGVRIKTWQGGIGSVKNISFSNIQVSEVKVPIMIDQYYCDKRSCKNQTRAVAISGIKYDQVIGSYSAQPIHLACSDHVPCIDVDLMDIQLKPSLRYQGFQQALCWNSYGRTQGPLLPSSIDYCLRKGGGSVQKVERSHEKSC